MNSNFDIRQAEIRTLLDQINSAQVNPMDSTMFSANSELTPVGRLIANTPSSLIVNIGASTLINPNTARNRSAAPINNIVPTFTGGTITFPSANGGTITVSPGTNNTMNCPAGEFVQILVLLNNAGQLSVIVGIPASSAALAQVPAPSVAVLPLGYITISNVGGVIQNVTNSDLYQFVNAGATPASSLHFNTFNSNGTFVAPTGVTDVEVFASNLVPYNPAGGTLLASYGDAQFAIANNSGTQLLYSWGLNASWILGQNNSNSSTFGVSTPVLVSGNHDFVQIAGNEFLGIALDSGGNAYTWGENSNGSIGDGTLNSRSSPVMVIGGHTFIQVASSNINGYGLDSSGNVWAWGSNADGQLGQNSSTPIEVSSPIQVLGAPPFIQITTTLQGAFGLTAAGAVYSWGLNQDGVLGTNQDPSVVVSVSSPTLVVGGNIFTAISGAPNGNNAYGLDSSGNVWAWGDNFLGQLGTGVSPGTTPMVSSPVMVIGGNSYSQVFAGDGSVFAVTSNGTAYAWGNNFSGQLGIGTSIGVSSPVALVGGLKFVQIAGSGTSSVGATSIGTLYSWGSNSEGQLGIGTNTGAVSSPVLVSGGLSITPPSSTSEAFVLPVTPGTSYPVIVGFNSAFAGYALGNATSISIVY